MCFVSFFAFIYHLASLSMSIDSKLNGGVSEVAKPQIYMYIYICIYKIISHLLRITGFSVYKHCSRECTLVGTPIFLKLHSEALSGLHNLQLKLF